MTYKSLRYKVITRAIMLKIFGISWPNALRPTRPVRSPDRREHMTKPSVFISSSREDLDVARELGRQIETTAAVTLWSESAFHPGKTVAESLTEVADRSDFAVFVITGDDVPTTGQRPWAPRPNVIFELG